MSKCCIYCRVANESTPAHSAALQNQLLSLRAAAEKLGLEVADELCYFEWPNDANRESMRRIIAGGEAGNYDCVLVANPGRLARDTHVMDEIGKAFHKAGLKVYTPDGEQKITKPLVMFYSRVAAQEQLRTALVEHAVEVLESKGYEREEANDLALKALENMDANPNGMGIDWFLEKVLDKEIYEETYVMKMQ